MKMCIIEVETSWTGSDSFSFDVDSRSSSTGLSATKCGTIWDGHKWANERTIKRANSRSSHWGFVYHSYRSLVWMHTRCTYNMLLMCRRVHRVWICRLHQLTMAADCRVEMQHTNWCTNIIVVWQQHWRTSYISAADRSVCLLVFFILQIRSHSIDWLIVSICVRRHQFTRQLFLLFCQKNKKYVGQFLLCTKFTESIILHDNRHTGDSQKL